MANLTHLFSVLLTTAICTYSATEALKNFSSGIMAFHGAMTAEERDRAQLAVMDAASFLTECGFTISDPEYYENGSRIVGVISVTAP